MKKIEVSAAIIIKDNKFFVTKRGYGQFKGMWEFPGGKLEAGETGEDCIIREIKEELDADIIVDSYLSTIDYDYETFHLTMHNYICHLKYDHIVLKEHDDAKFVELKDIDSVGFLPADILVVNDLKKKIS